jgi:transcriptional regulator with XRE-family HTH domain
MARKPPRKAPETRVDYAKLKGGSLLVKWRGERHQQDVADLIGIDLARYNAFENGRARPGIDWAFRIEEASRGAVPADSWAIEPEAIAS